jgi:hypothetical protein
VTLPPAERRPQHRADTGWHGPAAIALVLVASALAACTSAAPYRRVAAAGTAYAASVVSLSSAAGTLTIDASSARLLQDDSLADVDLATLRRFDSEDSHRLAVVARLTAHARLMQRYFKLLGDLASANAGHSDAAALAGLAAALDGAGEALRRDLGSSGVAAAVEPTRVAAALCSRALARRELEARAPLLRRELATERDVLASLAAAMRHDAGILAETRRQRLVVDPLLAAEPVADPERWIADRRALLQAGPALAELGAATRAADALGEAVDALAAGRVDLDRIEEVITDAEAVAAALAAAGLRGRETP